MRIFHKVVILVLFSLLIACDSDNKETKQAEIGAKVNLEERQKQLLSRSTFDLSKVSVARLKVGDKNYDVTSLKPQKISSFKTDKGTSVTLLVFDKGHEHVVFFTHDVNSNKGYERLIKIADIQSKKEFNFPVINSENGMITEQLVSPHSLIVQE